VLLDAFRKSIAVVAALLAAFAAAALAYAICSAASKVYRTVAEEERRSSGGIVAAVVRVFRGSIMADLARLIRRYLPESWRTRAAAALRRAGDPASLSAEELGACVLLGAAAFLVIGAAAATALQMTALLAPAMAAVGGLYPLLWLHDRVKARRAAIARALPYDLDLLTLSVEAGLDFAAALEKVVVKGRAGPLADELSITVRELRLGTRREEALRNLAARVALPALTSFAHALVQADRMGTPLAKVLRVLATQLRVERTLRAEKLAGEAPVKLLLPLIGCIFPTIFLMLFGPIIWEVYLGGSF
jgi:tight adherence protein C